MVLYCFVLWWYNACPLLWGLAAFTSPHIYFQCVSISFNTDLRMLLQVEFGEREAGKRRGTDRFSDAREEVSVLFYWP